MALRKTWATDSARGFSLLEILVVIGLLTIIGGFGVVVSMGSLQGTYFRNDRDAVVSALHKARSRAVSNMCFGGCTDGSPHGVHIDHVAHTYTVFQGAVYSAVDPLNETAALNPQTATAGFTDVVFTELSGDAVTNPGTTLSVTDISGRTSQIDINSEGKISWSN